jgi:PDZ domain
LELKQAEIYVFPVKAAISAADGRTVGGLLGYDFLNRFIVKIDYINRQIDVFEPTGFHDAGPGEIIPLDIIRGNILVPADLATPDGKHVLGTFLVDTGWRSALTLTSPFVANQKLLAAIPRTVEATTGMGIAGPTVDVEARIASLRVGRYKIENFVADLSRAKVGVLSQDDFAGIIGGEILRRFTIILDYPHHRMIIDPNSMFGMPFDIDMSGLFLTSESGSAAFKVYSVIKGSPGAQAGIQDGDVIETIDDNPASKFTLEQVRQMFKAAEGEEHRLTIRRNGKILTARIRLRRII